MRLLWIVTFLLIASVVSAGETADTTPTNFNEDTISEFLEMGEGGVISSFLADPEFKGSKVQRKFTMGPSPQFHGDFLVLNNTNEDIQYRVYVLVNYKAVVFSLNGEERRVQSVTIGPSERTTYDLRVDVENNRFNDVVLIALPFTNSGDRNPELAMISKRFLVVRPGAKAQEPAEKTEFRPIYAPWADKSIVLARSTSGNALHSGEESVDDRTIHVVVGAYGEKPIDAAIVLFSGDQQVRHKDGTTRLLTSIPGNSSRLHSVTVPNMYNNVWGILVYNPFSDIEPSFGNIGREPQDVIISNTIEFTQNDFKLNPEEFTHAQ